MVYTLSMKQVNEIIREFNLTKLDNYIQPLKFLGVKNSLLVLVVYVLIFVLNALGIGKGLALFAFGFIYPSQKTAEILVKPEVQEIKRWLSYWVVAAFVLIFDENLEVLPLFRAA